MKHCPFCRNIIDNEKVPLCPACSEIFAQAEAGLPCRFQAIACLHARARKLLTDLLKGKIFHITDAKGFLGITSSGKIEANHAERFGNNWGSKKSYFRNRGCISVCDFFNNTCSKKLYDAICKYNFYDLSCNKGLSYFMVLQKGLAADIVPWDRRRQDRETGGDLVPDLESGYPGDIPLSKLDSVIRIHIVDHFDEDAFWGN